MSKRKHQQNDYKPSEKFLNQQKDLEVKYTSKFDGTKKDVRDGLVLWYKDIFDDSKNKVIKIAEYLDMSLINPSERKIYGIDIKNAYDAFYLSIETGFISYQNLSTVVNLVSNGILNIKFEKGEYINFLINILDPLNDYCNEQYKLMEVKIKKISDEIMSEWKYENELLQASDIEHYNNQKTKLIPC